MAEPVPEQIVSALRSRFLAIASDGGTTYWYKPDAVLVCELTDTVLSGAVGVRTLYVIDPRSANVSEETSLTVKGSLECHLIVAYDMRLASVDPWRQTSHERYLYESRLVRDATRALLEDVTLGAVTINTVADSIDVEYGLHAEGEKWAIASLTFSVSYTAPRGTP